MKKNIVRIFMLITVLVMLTAGLSACNGAAAPAEGKIKVGLSFSDFATERWKPESELLTKLLEEKGYEVLVQEAAHDVKLQNDQIDNMVAQGVKGLIIVAEDGEAAVTAAEKAVEAGVKVIAYDRPIKTSSVSAYLTFDNTEVGRQEALGVMTALGIPGSTVWTKDNPAKVVLSGGSPTDNNAHLVRNGQMEVIQPYIDEGIIEIVADFWVENWDAAKALAQMENTLTAQQNAIDAVIASNDGTALGELTALKAQGLAGKVPISGQDATADGANSIVKGEQTVTVYKDFRLLAPKSVDTLDALIKGEAIEGVQNIPLKTLFGDEALTGDMACVFLPVVQVTKDNVYEEIVVSGFQPYDAVYRDIPADQLPPKPGEAAAATEAPAAEPILVGLSFSDFATERWKPESELLTKLLEAKGYKVLVQEAAHDVKLQNDQIDNMVAQGVKGLIIVAEDGAAAVTAAEKAAAAGVKVIAYDRPIKTASVSAYLTFDNTEVGRQEALGVMTALGIPGSTTWTAKNPAKVVLSGGSPTDNNAHLVRNGQMEVIQPYIDSGIIKVVADFWVENWDAAKALAQMENTLTAQQNKIDAVIASNDGTALGELTALKAQGLAGIVPISGQDATADGCNSIVKGEQTVTVYKDFRLLAPKSVDTLDALIKGEAIEGVQTIPLKILFGEDTLEGDMACVFLPVVQVTKDNVYEEIVVSGFQPYDAVYRDIPADQLPPKP